MLFSWCVCDVCRSYPISLRAFISLCVFRISPILCPLNIAILSASCKPTFICSLANLRMFFALMGPQVRSTLCIQSSDIEETLLTLPIHSISSSVSRETSFSVCIWTNKMHRIIVIRLYFLLDAYMFRTILVHLQEQLFISCTSHLVYVGICRYVWLLCGYSQSYGTGICQMRCTAYKVVPEDGLIQSGTCRASNRK